VALEDDYQLYREMIAVVLQTLRTDAKVECTTLEALEEEFKRFDPQVVICGGHEDIEAGGRPVWIELSSDPTLPAKISVGPGRCFELTNPTLEELLEIIDEFA
jgi:hypothetical protein